jgi:hypothetical protein
MYTRQMLHELSEFRFGFRYGCRWELPNIRSHRCSLAGSESGCLNRSDALPELKHIKAFAVTWIA